MSDPARLKAQMAELGAKFAERTRGEAAQILALIDRLETGDTGAAQELGYLVHRIHGGGATFGFDDLSDHAGQIERLIDPALRAAAPVTAQTIEQLRILGRRLQNTAEGLKTA